MRKSSVGSAVLGLLAVTVASIGATAVLMLFPFPNDRALFGCAGAGLWQCAVFTAGGLEPTAVEQVQIEVMMKKGTAVLNCGSFYTLRYLTVKKLPYSGSLRME